MKSFLICSLLPQIMAGVATMLLAAPVIGQDLGSVTHNGVEMKVKAAVAVWRLDHLGSDELSILLLPYVPTAAEIQRAQADKYSCTGLKSPDPKKWPKWSPYATYTLSWDRKKGSVGDHNQAWIFVYVNGIGNEDSNVNFNSVPGQQIGTLKGTIKVGEKIELIAKGKDATGENNASWDLRIRTEILAFTGK